METAKHISVICQERGITLSELAAKSGLDDGRVAAIISGRWTPSPSERDRVAAALGLTREQIVWGHITPIQHIYGHGPA
jgi:transcriptional regulator with XRE-family HTH domain